MATAIAASAISSHYAAQGSFVRTKSTTASANSASGPSGSATIHSIEPCRSLAVSRVCKPLHRFAHVANQPPAETADAAARQSAETRPPPRPAASLRAMASRPPRNRSPLARPSIARPAARQSGGRWQRPPGSELPRPTNSSNVSSGGTAIRPARASSYRRVERSTIRGWQSRAAVYRIVRSECVPDTSAIAAGISRLACPAAVSSSGTTAICFAPRSISRLSPSAIVGSASSRKHASSGAGAISPRTRSAKTRNSATPLASRVP